MTTPVTPSHPTAAEFLKAKFAALFLDFTDEHAAKIEQLVEDHEGPVIDGMIAFLDKHFDRTTIQARMSEGPLLGTLRNMEPDAEASINAALDDGFRILETYLAGIAKGGAP